MSDLVVLIDERSGRECGVVLGWADPVEQGVEVGAGEGPVERCRGATMTNGLATGIAVLSTVDRDRPAATRRHPRPGDGWRITWARQRSRGCHDDQVAPTFRESTKSSGRQRLAARARDRWPQITELHLRHRGVFTYVEATTEAGTLALCRLRYVGSAHAWQLAIYRASHDDYHNSIFPSGLPIGTCQTPSTWPAVSTSTIRPQAVVEGEVKPKRRPRRKVTVEV